MKLGYGTHVGQIREVNEDSLWCGHDILVVADGMGGAAAGEVASQLAVDAIKKWEIPPDDGSIEAIELAIHRTVRFANQKIYEKAQSDPALHGMGTTLTMSVFRNGRAVIAHVGDSRAYLVRNGALKQLTDDHSVVAEMVRTGELSQSQAEHHPYRNMLTRALGVARYIDVDLHAVPVIPGDGLFLCTDGLTAVVSDDEILDTILAHSAPQEVIDALIFLANERGGPDNISAIFAHDLGGRTDG